MLEEEATTRAPLETGGVLLGYWDEGGRQAVVTDWIGPGPAARHERNCFVPDHEFQEAEIARRYQVAEPAFEYLGDWHSHPDAMAYLSERDRATLLRIARTAEARAPRPVMLVLAGSRPWTVAAWRGERRMWWPCGGIITHPLGLRLFSAR